MKIYLADHMYYFRGPHEEFGVICPGTYYLKKGSLGKEEYCRWFNLYGDNKGPMIQTVGWSYIDRKGNLRAGTPPFVSVRRTPSTPAKF
jgi:hypothetical protein